MADIKVREVSRGTIKAIDHAAAASHRMKDAYVKTKVKTRETACDDRKNDESASSYAFDEMGRGAAAATDTAEVIARRTSDIYRR